MGLSLKQEEMVQFLEELKTPGENFTSMLWGTIYADMSDFQNHSLASQMIARAGAAGVAGSLDGAFCYIGLTDQSLYVVAVDSYNTSSITGTFAVPFTTISSLKTTKGLGSQTVIIDCGKPITLTVKSTSIGTNIKDQKQRMADFLTKIEALK